MNPAPCAHCGATVLTMRQFAAHIRPTTECPSCGKRVRMRGYYLNLFAAVTVSVAAITAASLTGSVLPLVGLALIAVVMEVWTWRALPWEPTEDQPVREAAASAGPGAAAPSSAEAPGHSTRVPPAVH